MSDAVLVALIGLVGSGIGAFAGVVASARLTQYRLKELEKKVQAHNRLVERVYILEGDMREAKNDIREIKGRASA